MRPMNDSRLYASAFVAAAHPNDQCGSNGLPLTPNSIRIIGRFQQLRSFSHPNLGQYVDLIRGKHEQIMIVSEGHPDTLQHLLNTNKCRSVDGKRVAFQILSALAYLHEKSIVHRNLCPSNIHLDKKGNIKLTEYGLYHMTEFGSSVSFPIGMPAYLAPEVLLLSAETLGPSRRRVLSSSDYHDIRNRSSWANVDTWSFGVTLLELLAGRQLWESKSLEEIINSVLQLGLMSEESALNSLIKELGDDVNLQDIDCDLLDVIRRSLIITPSRRPDAASLCAHSCFSGMAAGDSSSIIFYPNMNFSTELRCESLTINDIFREPEITDGYFFLGERSLEEAFYWWKLAGGDLESVLKRSGLLTNTPPIVNMCKFVSVDGDTFGVVHESSTMYNPSLAALDLGQLCERLSEVDPEDYYPLCEVDDQNVQKRAIRESAKLPLIIRERDVEYQFHRVVLFDRLLKGFPHSKPRLLKESRVDIPPLYRGQIWAAILDVQGDIYSCYNSIDKVSAKTIDRQIEVDIPRCHQYNELMSSPEAHKRLKRILKAWVQSHPQYVYWQGLDSLCAPFLYLHFNDEALAFACLQRFIEKYLFNFFMKDNSAVIQEYLALFSQLIAFHEPELSNHLHEIGFMPDLYAIPWFLTMYAHVFPLHKLFHLWDTLLLGASAFPISIAVAILQQLKSRLITSGFNECILLFSDLPEINMEQCVSDSVKVFCATPKSSTSRVHAPKYTKKESQSLAANELSAEPLPVHILRKQRCCQISGEEMLSLLNSPIDQRTNKPKLIVLDIRTADEYQRGTILGAIHAPYQSPFSANVKEFLDIHRYQVKVVVDSNNTQASLYAEKLLDLGYAKVCYLNKGINVLRGSNLLVVPSPQI